MNSTNILNRKTFPIGWVLLPLLLLLTLGLSGQVWLPAGNELYGELNQGMGGSVDLSTDGTRMIVGYPANSVIIPGIARGYVCVFELQNSTWQVIGDTLKGDYLNNMRYGMSVSISGDGNTIAIGEPGFSAAYTWSGRVQVFGWNGLNWVQKGSDFLGNANWNTVGYSVSLNNDGNLLAIGEAPPASTSAHVYSWNGSSWYQLGNGISYPTYPYFPGISVALGMEDVVLAIGLPHLNKVQVYKWANGTWYQRGSDIIGYGWFGDDVDLSYNGQALIVGAPNYGDIGEVRVYDWQNLNWIQRGGLYGATGEAFGLSVAISANGNIIACGAPLSDYGYAKCFVWSNNTWIQRGNSIVGKQMGDQTGLAVSLDSLGNTLAVGEPGCDTPAVNSGSVRVFSINQNYTWLAISACRSYTLPSGSATVINSGTYYDTLTNNAGGDSILVINLTVTTINANVHFFGNNLIATPVGAAYQWLDCDDSMKPIDGAIYQYYIPTVNGHYAVEVTQNGCVDTSNCYGITGIGLTENINQQFIVYPNPTKGTFILKCPENELPLQAHLYHISGKLISSQILKSSENELIINAPSGLYLLKLETPAGEIKVLRIVKN